MLFKKLFVSKKLRKYTPNFNYTEGCLNPLVPECCLSSLALYL